MFICIFVTETIISCPFLRISRDISRLYLQKNADQTIAPMEINGEPAWKVKAFIRTKFQRAPRVNPMDSPYTQPFILKSILVEWEPYPTSEDRFECSWEPWRSLMDDMGEDNYVELYNRMMERNKKRRW